MKKINKKSLTKNKDAVSHPLEFIMAFGILITVFILVFSQLSHLFIPYQKDDFVLRAKAMTTSEVLVKNTGMAEYGSTSETDWESFVLTKNLTLDWNLTSLGLASYIVLEDDGRDSSYAIAAMAITDANNVNSTMLGTIENLMIVNHTSWTFGPLGNLIQARVKKMIYNRTNYGTLDIDKIDALKKINYTNAKNALALEPRYDFNLVIKDVENRELLKYGKPYENAEVVGSFSRSVRVYVAQDPAYSEEKYITARLTVYVF